MFSTSHFAPTPLSSNWILLFECGYKNSLVITKIPSGTVQNHENPPVNTKNQPTFYFLLSTFYLLSSTFYLLLSTFYFLLSTFYFLLSTFYFSGSEDKPLQTNKQTDRPFKKVMIFRYKQTNRTFL